MLRELDLAYMVADDVLTITSPKRALESEQIHVYAVERADDIASSLEPMFAGAEMQAFSNNRLIVKAPFPEHRRFMRLLEALADDASP